MSADTTKQTEATLAHHLQAFGEGVDALLLDYTEDSVIFTEDGLVHGLAGARSFFEAFIDSLPEGFGDAFTLVRQDVEGEVAFIVWTAEPFVPLGTDTFVVRGGKIVAQTSASLFV
jgi:hypothetical protein